MSREDALRALRFLEAGKDYHRRLLDQWLPATGAVADVGCGLGHVTNFYDRPGRRVIGFDLNLSDLAAARSVDSRRFVAADAAALPLGDGSIAAYIGLGLIEIVPDGGAVLLEARRVLVDGGLIYLTVPYLNRRRRVSGTADRQAITAPAFTATSASALLAKTGFTLLTTRPSSFSWGLGPVPGRVIDRILAPLLTPASSLLIVGRK